MGIYIRLGSASGVSSLDRALARLHYCYTAIKYFQQPSLFLPQNVQIWRKAPSETLGGTKADEMPISDLSYTLALLRKRFSKSYFTEELFSSIVVFNGQWNFDGIKLSGFVSCNNNSLWKQAYHDIEIDAYAKGNVEDLTDVLLGNEQFINVVQSFITDIVHANVGQPMCPAIVYFSIGAPEFGEVENLIAIHLRDWREMIRFLYAKLRRSQAPWIKEQVMPIDRGFYVGSLTEQEITETIFKQVREETEIIEKTGNSITYIGKDKDSFKNFYERFEERIFKPASQELPKGDSLKKIMKKGLEGTTSLG